MGGGSGAPPTHTTPISCWLVPPEKPKAELSALVQKLASENGLPTFDVHITIIGDVLGEHCSSEAEAIERLQLLEHSGAVPCRFASIECFPPWNQSLMAVAEESPELCRLQRLAQQAFLGVPEAAATAAWAMPVGKPHCSLAYANTPLPPAVAAALRPPDGFGSTWSRGLALPCPEGPALPRGPCRAAAHMLAPPRRARSPRRLLVAALLAPPFSHPREATQGREEGAPPRLAPTRSRLCVGAETPRGYADSLRVLPPPRFVAWELALVQLTEPTAEGSTRWKKLASVSLARAP